MKSCFNVLITYKYMYFWSIEIHSLKAAIRKIIENKTLNVASIGRARAARRLMPLLRRLGTREIGSLPEFVHGLVILPLGDLPPFSAR
jgi:hypothetical protein